MQKIKTFFAEDRLNLEESVNKWLEENQEVEVAQIVHSIQHRDHFLIVLYREPLALAESRLR